MSEGSHFDSITFVEENIMSDSGEDTRLDSDSLFRSISLEMDRMEALQLERIIIDQILESVQRESEEIQQSIDNNSNKLNDVVVALNSAEEPVEYLISNKRELQVVLDLKPLLENNRIVVRLGEEMDQECVRAWLQDKGIPVLEKESQNILLQGRLDQGVQKVDLDAAKATNVNAGQEYNSEVKSNLDKAKATNSNAGQEYDSEVKSDARSSVNGNIV